MGPQRISRCLVRIKGGFFSVVRCRILHGSFRAVPVVRRRGLTRGAAIGNAACRRLDGKHRCSCRMEYRHGSIERYGALLRDACPRHRRTHSANFYLVPGTAALLGWMLLGEQLSYLAIFGLLPASVGCWLVNARPVKPLPKEL